MEQSLSSLTQAELLAHFRLAGSFLTSLLFSALGVWGDRSQRVLVDLGNIEAEIAKRKAQGEWIEERS
jgi:hypothetical protein